ncbi:MAG TPA: hypothetical protein VEB86_02850, partial [Chryseosolibacter sp.]|nr:hypothetical protein [Chryseosolibacter sp.]
MNRVMTSKQYFQTIGLTYYLQAFSLVVFAGVVYYLIGRSETPIGDDRQWTLIVPVILLIGMATSYYLFRLMVKRIDPAAKVQQKLPKYASALMVRSALLELPGLFSALVAYLTLRPYYLGGALMMFLVFLVLKPSRTTVAEDLGLNPKERDFI